MGLHVDYIHALKSAKGYEVVVVTFGLLPRSNAERAVHRDFAWMAHQLGEKGMFVTGRLTDEFEGRLPDFYQVAEDVLFESRRTDRFFPANLPVPGLIALQHKENGEVAAAYVSLSNPLRLPWLSSILVRTAFWAILRGIRRGDVSTTAGNLLRDGNGLGKALWAAVQIKPSIFGIGVDIKEFVSRTRNGGGPN